MALQARAILLVFEKKFTRAYLFQIALEMITLFHTQLIFLEDCEQF